MPISDGQVVNKDGIPVESVDEAIAMERERDPEIINLVSNPITGIYSLPSQERKSNLPQVNESNNRPFWLNAINRFLRKER